MKRFLHDILVIARQELADSVRSRRVAVFLLLYLSGAMLACYGFISVIHSMEEQLSRTLALPASASTGAVTAALWKSSYFREMIIHLIGDKAVAMELLAIPPVALIYGWLAFTFTPVLVMLSASGRMAEEIGAGSARFVLVRTSKAAWCMGKFLGQAMEVILALMLSAIGAWCMARWRMSGLEDWAAARAMVIYAWKVWIYALSFVGLALGLSQVTRSPYIAMGSGFGVWVAMTILGIVARHQEGEGARQAWQLVNVLVPMGHRLDLWRPDAMHVTSSTIFLLALAFSYLFIGHAVFSRRDVS